MNENIRARGVAALGEVYAGATTADWDALVDQLDTVGLAVTDTDQEPTDGQR